MNFALYDLRLSQQRCQMLLDEVCGDASRFLRPGFVPENTERSSLTFTGIQPVVGFEAGVLRRRCTKASLTRLLISSLLFGSNRYRRTTAYIATSLHLLLVLSRQ
jgi:hypothetical protein